MKHLRSSSIAACALTILAAVTINAQTTATTDPVGFMTIDLPVGSDTIVATPLTKAPVFQGAVSSLSGFTITATGASFGSLTSTPHYVQAITGSQAGIIFDVASNTTDTITIVNNGLSPTGLSNGVSFKVIPYWTLSQLFPSTDQGVSFTASASTTSPARRTQILTPNLTNTGINRSAAATYYFVTNTYWRSTAGGTNNFDGTPLLPDTYFIVRNTTNSAAGKLTVAGSVNTGTMTVQLDRATNQNDNYVSLGRPVDIRLNDLGLISSGAFQQSVSATTPGRRDQLLVFSNSTIGFNKAAAVTYYYVTNSGWRSTATGTNDMGSSVIPAAVGYVVRKATNATAGSEFWSNNMTVAP